ncbi:MAG: amino acid ABC transporter permease, partial [Desulfuromonadales bacterium]|nr:amino acid ABC transporter permease [Desulfuromonadales bacterium]
FITNRGIIYPIPVEHGIYPWLAVALVVGIIGAVILSRRSQKRREETGQYTPTFWPGLGLILGLPTIVWLAA